MRITQVNKYYWPPHLGGIEHSLNILASGLASRGHDVRALVANEGRRTVTERIDGVEVVRIGRLFAAASTPVALGMRAAIRRERERAEVLHMHFPYPWGEVSWLAADCDVPTVLTYHSDIVRQRRLLALYRPFLERMLERVDRIIVGAPTMIDNSPFLRPHAEKCRVVPFAIETERYEPTAELLARARRLRDAHDRPIVLFVGRLVYYKGAEVLVRAMPSFDADVVVIGTGPLEAPLRALAEELGVAERLHLVGRVSDEDLAAWYRAADVFCLPSVAPTEAYGLVQLEAHASGTPVISTNLPTGVPWVNQHGETGLVVEPGDADGLAAAIATLLGDDALRAQMGARARERVMQEFTIPTLLDRVIAVYDDAMGGA